MTDQPMSTQGSDPLLCRLLLAEDDEANAMYAEAVLRSCGGSVKWVVDGEQALAAFETENFDVVFLDLHMPVLDGLRATRAIRALESTQGRHRVPIVMVTASAMNHEIQECSTAGADDVLSKPFRIEELRLMLARWRS